MSVRAIRNQPFQFGSNLRPRSLAMGCGCDEAELPSLIALTDDIWAQALMIPCDIGGDTDDVQFSGGTGNWTGWTAYDGWFIDGDGYYRNNLIVDNNSKLASTTFTSVIGEAYSIQATFSGVSGTMYVEFGEQDFFITADGTYNFQINSAGDGPFSIGALLSGSATVESVVVSTLDVDVSATFHQEGEDDIVFEQSDYPGIFLFNNGTVTLHMAMADTGLVSGCFTLEIRSNCNDNGITSQRFRIVDAEPCDTLLIRACNDYDNMGFTVPFAPRIRIKAQMGRPTYNSEVEEERHSDGTIFRPYTDRTRSMTIGTGILNEFDHAFLSTLPLWDHVYIGEGDQAQEIVVASGKYEPSYGDEQWLNGAVKFDVSPKAELVRKVDCGPALGGCNPALDPICFDAQMTFGFSNAGDGMSNFNATLLSNLNFPPGTASVTVGGGAPVNKTFGTLPDTQTWGPFAEGTSITFRLQNSMNQNCVMTKFFDVPPTVFCGVPDLDYNFIDNEDSTFDLEITMNTTEGFTPGDIYVEQGGVTAGEQTFGSLPDTLTFVNLNNSQAVIVHFINLVEGCPPYVEDIGVPFVCAGEGYGDFSIDGYSVMSMQTTTGYYTVRDSSGAQTTYDSDEYNPSDGTSCFWASNSGGIKTGTITGIRLEEFVSLNLSEIGTGVTDIALTSEIHTSYTFSQTPNAATILWASSGSILELDFTSNASVTTVYGQDNPSLATVHVPVEWAATVVNFGGCNLNQGSVDDILVATAANGLAANIALDGGTNASPSATGLAAKATIISNGGTVFTN